MIVQNSEMMIRRNCAQILDLLVESEVYLAVILLRSDSFRTDSTDQRQRVRGDQA